MESKRKLVPCVLVASLGAVILFTIFMNTPTSQTVPVLKQNFQDKVKAEVIPAPKSSFYDKVKIAPAPRQDFNNNVLAEVTPPPRPDFNGLVQTEVTPGNQPSLDSESSGRGHYYQGYVKKNKSRDDAEYNVNPTKE